MRRLTVLFFVSIMFCASAYAAEIRPDGPVVLADRKAGEVRVVMYMTTWWPYCGKAREDLKRLGVKLVEYDIEKNEAKKKEMKRLTGGSSMVPVIDVEGIIIRGYAADEIQDAVETKRKGSR